MRRRTSAMLIAPALAALLVLSACGGKTEEKPKETASKSAAKAGSGSIDGVNVTGDASKKPTVNIEKPFKVTSTQTKVLSEGKGDTITEGSQVILDYLGINGRDGKEFDSSWSRGKPASFNLTKGQMITGFVTGLVGKKIGSRVVVAISPKDGYGPQGGNAQAGIKKDDTLVFVVDLKKAYKPLKEATGDPVAAVAGLPTVKYDAKGIPQNIDIPKTEASKTLVVQPLIKGKGEKVGAGATVTVNLLGTNYRSGKLVESTWKTGQPYTLGLAELQVSGVVEGLTGQTVGSRMLLVLPPDKGFKADLPKTDVKKNDTVVMVIDILGAY